MSKNLDSLRNKPEQLCNEIERRCRERDIPLEWRQNGTSHRVGKTPNGIIVVPVHGEIKKGTFGSILKTLAGLGIAIFLLVAWLATLA